MRVQANVNTYNVADTAPTSVSNGTVRPITMQSMVLFVCFALIALSNGFLLRGRNIDVLTKDVSEGQGDVANRLNGVEVPATAGRQCAKVGEFCMNHKDCCSNSCLGYMKRCVSS